MSSATHGCPVNAQDHYSILGVAPGATPDEIKARFRYLAQAYHPDKFASDGHRQAAEEDFKRINEAYQILSDPIQRANFDQSRAAASQPSPDQSENATEGEPQPAEAPPPDATPDSEADPWTLQQQRDRELLRRWAWVVGVIVLAGGAAWYWGFYVPAKQAKARAIESHAAERGAETTVAAPSHGRFVNSLGMQFVPVPGTKVLFSIWETRVKDYRAFAASVTKWGDGAWDDLKYVGQKVAPTDDSPVPLMRWSDSQAFCKWLTMKERAEGKISTSQRYRLPTDAEWSVAAGLNESLGGAPKDKDAKTPGIYPWGTQWPPPINAGNYADATAKRSFNKLPSIEKYDDGYATTSPVGSFAANRHGIFDLGGNVWEWCEDFYDGRGGNRVMRGGSWYNREPRYLLSSARHHMPPDDRFQSTGFRCVLAEDASQ